MWFKRKTSLFLRVCVCTRGVVRGVICKCTQNCRRRGAAVGPRSSAAEVETRKKKKNRRCACSQSEARSTPRRSLNGRCGRWCRRREKLHRPARPQQPEPPLSAAESAFRAPNSALSGGEEEEGGVGALRQASEDTRRPLAGSGANPLSK